MRCLKGAGKAVESAGTVFLGGEFVPGHAAAVSPLDRGFIFADGVYEVIRSYRGRLFERAAHFDRLRRSLREIRIGTDAANGIEEIMPDLLERNGLSGSDALIYIQVTRGAAPRRHQFPVPDTVPTVYAHAVPFEPPVEQRSGGIPVILVPDTRWSRCDIKSIALLPNILARQMAEDAGAGEAVFVRDGIVTEGSSSTFCAVFSGTVVAHPESNVVLPGITRRVVFDLCSRNGIPVSERPFRAEELPRAAEMMVLSTIREVMPVVSIDGAAVGDGTPGQLTRRIQAAFSGIIRSL
jgi:D-alanine transaminase